MPEWSTYSLSDFLMFSPQAYWRLVARHNLAAWPLQLAASLVPLLLAALVRRAGAAVRIALLLPAAAWAWVGWGFHWQRYGEIFLAAPWLAAACAAQALSLAAAAFLAHRWAAPAPAAPAPASLPLPALALLAAALLYPLLAPLTGHPWSEAEVFGFMPEPTALATLGVLWALRGRARGVRVLLSVLPVLSLLLGAATRWLVAQ